MNVIALFQNHMFSRNGDIAWPLHSPDLTTCDSFLWKSKVNQDNSPRRFEALKEWIRGGGSSPTDSSGECNEQLQGGMSMPERTSFY